MNEMRVSEMVTAGIHAGAVSAIKKARQFGTRLIVSIDGKIAEITPDEAEAMLKDGEKKQDQK